MSANKTMTSFTVHFGGYLHVVLVKAAATDRNLERVNSVIYGLMLNKATMEYREFTVKARITAPIVAEVFASEYEQVLRTITNQVRERAQRQGIVILGIHYLGRDYENYDGWSPDLL